MPKPSCAHCRRKIGGRLLSRPKRDYPAATVVGFCTAALTSADNLDFIRPEHLARSYRIVTDAIDILEEDWIPVSLNPKGEPQLGRRGLYASVGGPSSGGHSTMPMLWVLNLADGRHSLIDMAERSGLPFSQIIEAARRLREHDLLRPG
ncbi:MAG: hypothetical protein KL801_08420 [Mesorhizobium sp.]|nr:hypothetical protein [Mesorhizobium sp.]